MTEKVYFNHDGGVDDLVSLFLLLQMDEVELVGVGVVDADSYVIPAAEASRKIIDRFSHAAVPPVAISNSRAVHPFPKEWRLAAYSENSLPLLNENGKIETPITAEAAHLDLLHKLQASTSPLSLLFTGPLSDLARALEIDPAIEKKIKRLIWMGGTFLDKGNVAEPDCDGTQEWNAFWDPEAVKRVFDSSIPIDLVSLESTNNVPLTQAIRQRWASQRRFTGLDFIGNSYAFVPELSFFETNSTYYLWDVLTTCYFFDPSIVKTKEITCDVKVDFPSDGRTFLTSKGRRANLIYDVNNTRFFDLIDELAKKAD
ncbi:ABC transporter binding protein [Liquorilactobacillus sucicola DSM 21376 = JCM 15457]|uniref:ABC transporter binding protein n=1 Tax=Liquorilactobacillus sucicola DSM 21376 = JCM 15457 TaxID=1423806 RepID=A0A0R2E1T1_9LACO|nr:nucleoside hydrolase [Liquorilactobacillus sucicola]KRN06762.1 ABC transporter binding protein [Liquorilactobacillus sucicola DSM 21376 = JCM 15457]